VIVVTLLKLIIPIANSIESAKAWMTSVIVQGEFTTVSALSAGRMPSMKLGKKHEEMQCAMFAGKDSGSFDHTLVDCGMEFEKVIKELEELKSKVESGKFICPLKLLQPLQL
jgi:hypothetical protein